MYELGMSIYATTKYNNKFFNIKMEVVKIEEITEDEYCNIKRKAKENNHVKN